MVKALKKLYSTKALETFYHYSWINNQPLQSFEVICWNMFKIYKICVVFPYKLNAGVGYNEIVLLLGRWCWKITIFFLFWSYLILTTFAVFMAEIMVHLFFITSKGSFGRREDIFFCSTWKFSVGQMDSSTTSICNKILLRRKHCKLSYINPTRSFLHTPQDRHGK